MKRFYLSLVFVGLLAQQDGSSASDAPKRKIGVPGSYLGTVGSIGSDWIELKIGWKSSQVIDGQGDDRTPKHDNTMPKRFSTAGTTPGGKKDGDGNRETYRLSDLKVGDKIQVETGMSECGSDEWTREIRLLRRPGGKVPPVPGEDFATDERGSHMRMRAYQDWEERGIPIPRQFLGFDGRSNTDPPYPPVAPPPRPILKEMRISE